MRTAELRRPREASSSSALTGLAHHALAALDDLRTAAATLR
jgi:hypothetical protein